MLKRVSIQNFKSLKDVTLDLQKVNLLIGPNNSGKTNFLKALEYMVKDNTNQEEPEYGRLIFNQQKGKEIKIELLYSSDERSDDEGVVCIVGDNATIQKAAKMGQRYSSFLHFNPEQMKAKLGPCIIYKPDPNKLTQPSIVGTGAEVVNADASNLIAFFDFIRDDQPVIFDKIKDDLNKCVPEFTEINFQSIPSNEGLVKLFGPGTFKRLGLTNDRQNVKYWADELSEGTLYFVALLCIINQPNPPKLLLLEEPEKGIHPRRIHEVIQFILRLSEEKDVQVIMTTHSPIVVDMFKDMPESVFIFDKDGEGATHVNNLLYDVIEPETAKSKELGIEPPHYTDSLGDAWTVGFLGGVPK
ncbi:chromosome segregation protein SMC [Fibrisoma montanum]|uniref:Chromosome segregation protein SMC n=1 Tax=Fibrisoma montanum TaxID=2305895 RepID=A0A418M0D4_9BACT|nr:AAA family ATPase [Fibrisoma montanum]RIV19132.1 chromosome segregation protein SMC [Fibrisoma montanum]